MKLLRFFLVLAALIFFLPQKNLQAQGEIDDENKIFYRDERSVSFALNLNGWGFDYLYGRRNTAYKKWLFLAGFDLMKHPREERQTSYFTAGRFAYGKLHSTFNFKAGWGRQTELFRKFDKGSVSIRYYYILGPSVVILKPIYYDINLSLLGEIVSEKFDESYPMVYEIYGTSSFFKGFDELSAIPGGYLKAGFMFDFSNTDKKVRALDTGLSVELFPKAIPIMASDDNYALWLNVYIAFRFGNAIDTFFGKEGDEIN